MLRVDPDVTAVVTVYELYASFLIANGMARFASGLSEAQQGHWVSNQVEHFRLAMVGVQRLLDIGPVVPIDCAVVVPCVWLQHLGFPPGVVSNLPGLTLPYWQEARDLLKGLSTFLWQQRLLANHAKGVEVWRHWPVGISDSQMSFVDHCIPHTSILYTPRVRLVVKRPTLKWHYQRDEAQDWFSRLRSNFTLKGFEDRDHEMYRTCALFGVHSVNTKRALTVSLHASLARFRLLAAHLEQCSSPAREDCHIGSVFNVAGRLVCEKCGHTGPFSLKRAWLIGPCKYKTTKPLLDAAILNVNALVEQLRVETETVTRLLKP
eukprot:5325290-Amphidinium_carterae.1